MTARDAFAATPVGVASLAALVLMTLACFGSILWSPHPYDAVYRDYVQVPASLAAHPGR